MREYRHNLLGVLYRVEEAGDGIEDLKVEGMPAEASRVCEVA